ncbi:hypothetical protein H1P_1870014 [Hyella patelloides LEGE 07179]|uniref:Uncharacterized protein n=1 Tax=Hyella patelloides LEGE 07179 TaxID=945734 RepID=A0A563VP22_9CYAN|nr:hypothetical protein H1P_1870014 [Hyella patelloides LEGE 07179]
MVLFSQLTIIDPNPKYSSTFSALKNQNEKDVAFGMSLVMQWEKVMQN